MKPLPWSHSTLDAVKTCAKQYYHTRIAKDAENVFNDRRDWGSLAHKAVELALKGNPQLAPEFSSLQWYVDKLLRFQGERYVEHKLGIDKDHNPVTFLAKDVWSRCVIDYLVVKEDTALIIDHKFGKKKPSKQLLQNSLLVFANYPQVNKCKTLFAWLKDEVDDGTTGEYKREDMPALWAGYDADLAMYNETFERELWTARPSGLCHGWCGATKCQFWKPKRT